MKTRLKKIKSRNKAVQRFIDKYFKTRYYLILIIGLLLFFLYSKLFMAAFLMIIFIPLVAYSFVLSKVIPHINVDLLSGTSLLLGYLYGPTLVVIYTLVAGFYSLYKSSHVRFLLMIRIFGVAMTSFVMAMMTHLDFNMNFIIGIVAQNIILFFVYKIVDPDPIQNYSHRISHLISNLLILRYVFLAIYSIL